MPLGEDSKDDGSSTNGLLGRAELLAWAQQVSGVQPCAKYDDLKDGLVFLSLFEQLFPGVVDPNTVKSQRSGTHSAATNWEQLRIGMHKVGIPLPFCERKGVAAGHQRPCYNALVMFYFLTKLSSSSDFSVDFAHPIDDGLAAFLQSAESLHCLQKSKKQQEATAAATNQKESIQNTSNRLLSVSPAPPVASPGRGRPLQSEEGPLGTREVQEKAAPSGDGKQNELLVAKLRSQNASLERSLEMIREELNYVRQLGAHTLEQQKVLFQAEVARKTDHFNAQLATLRLETEHEKMQFILKCREELDATTDEIALMRDEVLFGAPQDIDRANYMQLKQQCCAYSASIDNLNEQISLQHAAMEHLSEEVKALRDTNNKLVETFQAGAQSVSGDHVSDVIFKSVSIAEQAPIVARLRQLQLEVESLKLADARSRQAIDSVSGNRTGDSFEGEIERSRLQSQVEKLRAANEMLRAKLQRNDRQEANCCDPQEELLCEGVFVPSSQLPNTSVESATAELLRSIKQAHLGAEQTDTLTEQVWQLSAFVGVYEQRLKRAANSLRQLFSEYLRASQALTVQRFQADDAQEHMKTEASLSFQQLKLQSTNEISQARLELQLMKEENERLRAEVEASSRRLQSAAAAIASGGSSQDLMRAERVVQNLKLRDAQWRELSEELRRMLGERAMDARVRALYAQLQAPVGDAMPSREASSRQQESITSLQAQMENCVRALSASQEEVRCARQEIAKLRTDMQSQSQSADKSRLEKEQLLVQVASLREDLQRYQEAAAAAEATLATNQKIWDAQKEEMKQYIEDTISALGSNPRTQAKPAMLSTLPLSSRTTAAGTTAAAAPTVAPPQLPRYAAEEPPESVPRADTLPKPTVMSPMKADEASMPRITVSTAGASEPAGPTSVLSSAELEKRKQEILAKYGIRSQ